MSKSIIPSGGEVVREAVIVLAGALLAAAVMQAFPKLKAWVKAQIP